MTASDARRRAAVVGAGTMGRGIAQVAAAGGYEVRLHDVSGELIATAIEGVASDLEGGVARGKVTPEKREDILDRLRAAADLGEAASGAELVVEAVPEDLDLKIRVFRQLDEAAPEGALLATNTSSLPVGRIAEATRHPRRVLGMHFFNPVPRMPLLEIVRAEATADATVERALRAGRRMGKEPIIVRDVPGFASSRLGLALGLEAMRMLEQGVASPEDIDKAMTLGYRHPMGPLRLTDLVGLDVRLAIAEHLHRELGEAFRPPEILRRLVSEGKLGKKTGLGFYAWDGE